MNDQDYAHLDQLKKQAGLLRSRACTPEQAAEAIEHFVEKFVAGVAITHSWMDVTGHILREQALEESENKYRTIFECSPDGILIAETQTRRCRYANPTICKMLGYSRAELEGMAADNLHPKKDLPRAIAIFESQAEGDIALAADIPMLRKDGTVFYADINSVPIVMDGKTYLLDLFRDITDRKQAEQVLRESEEKHRAIFEQAADAIVLLETQTGSLVDFNAKALKNLGYTRKEFQKLKTTDFQIIESTEEITKGAVGVIRKGPNTFMTKHRTKDGRIRDILVSYKAISIHDRSFSLAIWRDVTEQKQAEQALRESEEKYHALFEQAVDSIVLIDVETGTLLEFNKQAHENLGYSREEFQELKIADFEVIESAEEVVEYTPRVIREDSETFETKHKTKDGQIRDVAVTAKSISIGGRVLRSAIWRDVTKRKRAEEDIRQYQKRLQSLAVDLSLAEDQERRRLANSLHDNAGQLLSLAKIKLSTLDDLSLPVESKKSLAEIEQLVEQAELSTRTLTFQIYNPALHDLGFEPAVEWLAQNIQESYGLKVDLADNGKHKPMDGPLRVVMFQCLREVLINVAKHAKVDRARVDIAHRHHFVRVTIEDLGVGFDSQDSPDKNRGFGLFSIRERITQLGGQVEVKSSPGRGTMVILEGPISTDNHKTTRNRP